MRSFIAALAVIPTAYAVTLSDFRPLVSGLTGLCQTIYTVQILGCSASDFSGGKGCSDNCIKGLQTLVQPLVQACSGEGIVGNNVVNAFITGDGVRSLCPNAASMTTTYVATSSTPTTTSTPQVTTTQAPSTTDTPTTSNTPSTSSSSPSSTVVVTTSSSTTSSSSSLSTSTSGSSSAVSSTPVFIYSSSEPTSTSASSGSSTTSTTTAKSTPASGAGGGSPFDITNGSSATTALAAYPLALFFSALLAAYVL